MPLHRLVYYSRNRVREEGALLGEIDQILAASRRNNAVAGITGALMFNAGCFAQVLEGPQAILEATFERIQQDERHGDVSLLSFSPAETRAFGNWSMGFIGASRRNADSYAGIASSSGFDPATLTGENVFQILHGLALQEEDALA